MKLKFVSNAVVSHWDPITGEMVINEYRHAITPPTDTVGEQSQWFCETFRARLAKGERFEPEPITIVTDPFIDDIINTHYYQIYDNSIELYHSTKFMMRQPLKDRNVPNRLIDIERREIVSPIAIDHAEFVIYSDLMWFTHRNGKAPFHSSICVYQKVEKNGWVNFGYEIDHSSMKVNETFAQNVMPKAYQRLKDDEFIVDRINLAIMRGNGIQIICRK